MTPAATFHLTVWYAILLCFFANVDSSKAKIMGDRKRHQRHKDKIDRKSDKRRRVKSVEVTPAEDSSTLSNRDRRMVASMINGVNNASKHDSSMNGRLIRTRKNDSASSELAVTFDYFGNPL